MRVWLGANYDTSIIKGESATFTIAALGGVNPQPGAYVPVPDLAGMTAWVIIPQPSTITLGVLGAAVLLYRRRK